ncbi:polysaccharide deacetylase family protein [Chryseobacterium sp. SSA4.19]|uniref:polysaccharide deacetylase family protein n=1 Tax=Chryseobacterium sp. SSA4.19 TaxID=2919915 RepID=UPI001F4D7D7D|nr:polysaccharide deacetylase family protein [Chryseobacterium sp. SSA4.19]MCJ8153619.1 polysaccharide deacetylase family protein [Chryseobacterium sp. SSA4.19]
MLINAVILLTIAFIIIYFRLYLFLFPKNRLIILMYHQIEKSTSEDLTVSLENIEKQFEYLSRKKFTPKFFSELQVPSKKNIIITFDDGYKNNGDYLPSLLKKHNLKATIFIPTKFIQEGYKDYEMMTFEEIRNLDKGYFEIALHSHSHQDFRNISADDAANDLKNNMKILDSESIGYSKVLAYPYGKYPKENTGKAALCSILKNLDIMSAVRIGNKVNYFPSQKPYELCRIDIKGKDSMIHFKLKLIFGRLKLF